MNAPRTPESRPGSQRAAETLSAMRPEDVSDELIDQTSERLYGYRVSDPEDREHLAAILAAGYPAIARQVREQVAAEIEAARPSSASPGPRHKHYSLGLTRAAQIARGEDR